MMTQLANWWGRRRLMAKPKPAWGRRRAIQSRLRLRAKELGWPKAQAQVAFGVGFQDRASALAVAGKLEQELFNAQVRVSDVDPTEVRVTFVARPDAGFIAGTEAYLNRLTKLLGGPGGYWDEDQTKALEGGAMT